MDVRACLLFGGWDDCRVPVLCMTPAYSTNTTSPATPATVTSQAYPNANPHPTRAGILGSLAKGLGIRRPCSGIAGWLMLFVPRTLVSNRCCSRDCHTRKDVGNVGLFVLSRNSCCVLVARFFVQTLTLLSVPFVGCHRDICTYVEWDSTTTAAIGTLSA